MLGVMWHTLKSHTVLVQASVFELCLSLPICEMGVSPAPASSYLPGY